MWRQSASHCEVAPERTCHELDFQKIWNLHGRLTELLSAPLEQMMEVAQTCGQSALKTYVSTVRWHDTCRFGILADT